MNFKKVLSKFKIDDKMTITVMILIALLFAVVLTSLFYHKKIIEWIKNHKKIMTALVTVMVAAPTAALLYLGDQPVEPPIITDSAAYIWNSGGSGYGSIPHWEANKTYAQKFLQNNLIWNTTASQNGNTWFNASQYLHIGFAWNESICGYKVTLTLNTTGASQAYYYRLNLACNKILRNYTVINNWNWLLTIPANNTEQYTINFNWSDIKNLIQQGAITFNHTIVNDFFHFKIQTVTRINPDRIFVVDPLYGVVSQPNVSYWRYSASKSILYSHRGMCRINNSNYYLTVAYGDAGSASVYGWAKVLHVWGNNGTIQTTLVDSYKYDSTDGTYACVQQLPGTDIYAVFYYDSSSAHSTIITFHVSAITGLMTHSRIDTQNTSTAISYCDFQRITNNIFAIAGRNGSYKTDIETWWIRNNGTINNTRLSFWNEACGAGVVENMPYMAPIDSNTIAVVWSATSVTYVGKLATFNISGTGVITRANSISNYWNFSQFGYYGSILPISGDVYAIITAGSTNDGWINTTTISKSGKITNSWIDTQKFDNSYAYFTFGFPINVGSVYGLAYRGSNNNGYVCTLNISKSGIIGNANISQYQYDPGGSARETYVCYVNKSYYFILHEGDSTTGWCSVVNIFTNWAIPTLASPSPTNNSINQVLTPQCAITIADKNGDLMNLSWYENSTGSYVYRGYNNSCANGTYKWTFTQATANSQKYYWKVRVNDSAKDGTHNVSTWYCFTTIAGGAPASRKWYTTIRNTGIDYFVWLGGNTTAYFVKANITGFDEATEYVAIWKNTTWNNSYGAWSRYKGDKTGINFTIHTFDVVEVYLTDAGTQTFCMTESGCVNYTNSKTYVLRNSTKNYGWNYSGFNRQNTSMTTLSAINASIDLPDYYYIALWNQTTYTWNYYVSRFWEANKNVWQWDVIMTKVDSSRTWVT